MEQYRDFAFVYDELMNEVDYNGWVKYIEDIIKNENLAFWKQTFIFYYII